MTTKFPLKLFPGEQRGSDPKMTCGTCREQLPRWSVFLFGGVMSHAEPLRQFPVTVVCFTLRWLIVRLGAIASETNPSPSSHWYLQLLLRSCLYLCLFSITLRIDRCCSKNKNWRRTTDPAPRGWHKHCQTVSLNDVLKPGLPGCNLTVSITGSRCCCKSCL